MHDQDSQSTEEPSNKKAIIFRIQIYENYHFQYVDHNVNM